MTICVFASSSSRIDNEYATAATSLGKSLAHANMDVVYGGGGIGLMGKLADAVLESGGLFISADIRHGGRCATAGGGRRSDGWAKSSHGGPPARAAGGVDASVGQRRIGHIAVDDPDAEDSLRPARLQIIRH